MADVETHQESPQIEAAADARRRAALQAIRQWGDPVLKTRARDVTVFDQALREELDVMGQLMHDARGVGLAANQVGTLHRVLVYAVDGGEGPVRSLVNPEIEWRGDEVEVGQEGCLSLPGVGVDVERTVHLRVRAQDGFGESIVIEASGFEARIIQHEMDHLDGVLILDRAARDQRKQALRSLRAAIGDAA
ncbi:Peptide deformylase [Patulibacter medicamentivorans]|uniref:Peptide deformylase n=1 Tax=Patulibacter medicamentivorans TaxID=1097667 RepID=H0E2C6_9ACTN|nr:peptide deformylase [Patulibacter medicamentivorans]EHN12146.1 Peptide deformylase [Patulibacter medicamentivorans]